MELSSVLLVCKYGNLFDDTYKRTLYFYRKIFFNIFNLNLSIIITNVKNTNEWKEEQLYSGKNPETLINNFKNSIQEELGIDYEIITFTINAIPINSKDIIHAKKIRNIIFDRCFISNGIHMSEINYPKQIPILTRDNEIIIGYENEIDGIQIGIELSDKNLSEITGYINTKDKEIKQNL